MCQVKNDYHTDIHNTTSINNNGWNTPWNEWCWKHMHSNRSKRSIDFCLVFFFYLRNLHRNERRRQLLRSIPAMFTQMCFNGGFEILVSFFKLWRKITEKNELDFYIKRIVCLFLSKRIYDADVRTKQMDLNLENTTRFMDFVVTCDINSICGGF